MTAPAPLRLHLNGDQLLSLARRAGVHDLPAVLGIRTRHATVQQRDDAFRRADQTLLSQNVIADGVVHADLVAMLKALERPDRGFAVRLVTPDGSARISAVRRGSLGVLVRRVDDDVVIRLIDRGTGMDDVAQAVIAELPRAATADVQPISAPLPDMVDALSGTGDARELADRIRAVGSESRAAMIMGMALAARRAFAEIVYGSLTREEDRVSRSAAAVAVFYTERGRIVAAPSRSPAGQLWTTFKAGSDHAVRQALRQLVELVDEGWESS